MGAFFTQLLPFAVSPGGFFDIQCAYK